jgi:hypothetical protein
MGFSHVGIAVREDVFEETLNFYLTALAPLGYKELMRPAEKVVGIGANWGPEFWVAVKEDANEKHDSHIAFWASSNILCQLALRE